MYVCVFCISDWLVSCVTSALRIIESKQYTPTLYRIHIHRVSNIARLLKNMYIYTSNFSCCVFDWYIKYPAAHSYAITFAFQSNVVHISFIHSLFIFLSLFLFRNVRWNNIRSVLTFDEDYFIKFLTHIPSNGMKFESAILIYMISFTCARCVCKYGEWTDVLHTCIFYVCKWFLFFWCSSSLPEQKYCERWGGWKIVYII